MLHRPPVVSDGDKIAFRVTRPSEARIAYTFIEALNEGTLFDGRLAGSTRPRKPASCSMWSTVAPTI